MGFYPVCPGKPYYDIGSPLFDEVLIHLPGGKTFTIRAEENSPKAKYIQSAEINGKPYNSPSWFGMAACSFHIIPYPSGCTSTLPNCFSLMA